MSLFLKLCLVTQFDHMTTCASISLEAYLIVLTDVFLKTCGDSSGPDPRSSELESIPDGLGINPRGRLEDGVNVAQKEAKQYRVIKKVKVLQSSAASVVDDWSVPSSPYKAAGGDKQYFCMQMECIEEIRDE
jgi:hypothetical protein